MSMWKESTRVQGQNIKHYLKHENNKVDENQVFSYSEALNYM